MRCPHCRRKVHPDDIYCVFCSASLRGKSPSDPWNCICGDADTHRSHRRPSRKPTFRTTPSRSSRKRTGILIAILLLILFLPAVLLAAVATVSSVAEEVTMSPAIAPEPESLAAEDAWKLGTVIARWEGFTVTANSISMGDETGELELIYTAENRTDRTIVCADAAVTVEGFGLSSLLYLELEPGETVTDYLWIDTDMLTAVDITRLQALTISLRLTDGEDYTDLAWTEPVSVALDFDLPELGIRPAESRLAETEELAATLVGFLPEPEQGGMTLYILMENRSEENAVVFLDNALCGGTNLHLYSFYEIPAGTRLLAREPLYDIPYASDGPTVISFDTELQMEEQETSVLGIATITLEPEGTSGSIRSEWE